MTKTVDAIRVMQKSKLANEFSDTIKTLKSNLEKRSITMSPEAIAAADILGYEPEALRQFRKEREIDAKLLENTNKAYSILKEDFAKIQSVGLQMLEKESVLTYMEEHVSKLNAAKSDKRDRRDRFVWRLQNIDIYNGFVPEELIIPSAKLIQKYGGALFVAFCINLKSIADPFLVWTSAQIDQLNHREDPSLCDSLKKLIERGPCINIIAAINQSINSDSINLGFAKAFRALFNCNLNKNPYDDFVTIPAYFVGHYDEEDYDPKYQIVL